MEAVECGAASLAMVLASYGRWISLEEARLACGVSRDGSSAFDILEASKNYGMEAKGLRVDMDYLNNANAPLILHWGFAHYVVFCGKVGPLYIINDPARGKCFLTRREVAKQFTGICLKMCPSEQFTKGGEAPSIPGFVHRHLHGAVSALLFTMIISLLLAVVSLALPIFSQVFVDGIMTGTNPEWATPFLYTISFVALYQFIVNCIAEGYGMRQRARLAIVGSSKFVWHILRLPMRFFSMRMTGDIIRRIGEAGEIPVLLVGKLAPVVSNMVLLVVYLYFMISYSMPLTGIVAIAFVLILLTTLGLIHVQKNLSRQSESCTGKLYGIVMSSIESIETIKAAGAEEGFFHRWARVFAEAKNAEVRQDTIMAYGSTIPTFLTQLAGNMVFVAGCKFILDGNLTIGMLMAFQGFMNTFAAPLTQIISTSITMSTMQVKMERVDDVFRSEPDVVAITEDKRDPGDGKLRGEVELRNVTFGYNVLAEPLIEDFSMHIKPGHSVAFVGASGCGKSTLANLVSGLYEPWKGDILYDGKPISEINRATFTSSVSVIDQDASFFDGTVSDNIKLWDKSIEDFALILACRDAEIHDEISVRPKSYESQVDEGARNFSGGQRQRMGIASALVKEPIILIMDEATSALDAATEAKVMQNIRMQGITLIIIAHRLSTIRDCDEIIVMDQGKVVERGTHQELMNNRNKYYNLVADA